MLGPDGQAGIDALLELQGHHGALPQTPRSRTGSGGQHYFFRWPASGTITNRQDHLGLPIDVRGEGGLAVVPPSRNANGPYVWEVAPWDVALAEAPDWLIAWCRTEKTQYQGSNNGHSQSNGKKNRLRTMPRYQC
jgi:putative DNA primase/helicase